MENIPLFFAFPTVFFLLQAPSSEDAMPTGLDASVSAAWAGAASRPNIAVPAITAVATDEVMILVNLAMDIPTLFNQWTAVPG